MRTRIVLGAIGVAMICFAAFDAVGSPDLQLSKHLARLVAVLIFHDVVWMAVVAGVGTVIHRTVPGRYRAITQGATIVTASVTIVALPFMLGFGRTALVPSALPRNYLGGYAALLGGVWLVAIALILRRHLARPAAQAREPEAGVVDRAPASPDRGSPPAPPAGGRAG